MKCQMTVNKQIIFIQANFFQEIEKSKSKSSFR